MEKKTYIFKAEDKLLNINEVMAIMRLSKARIYELMKQDIFPRPVKIGFQRVAWIEREVIDYINECIAGRMSAE